MRRKRTIIVAILSALMFFGQAAKSEQLFHTFAGCTGRLSAQLEHAWLLSDPAADIIEGQRLTFVSLLDTVTPAGFAKDALAKRIDAKMAQARLLTIAQFDADPARAASAQRLSKQHLSACQRMLLDS